MQKSKVVSSVQHNSNEVGGLYNPVDMDDDFAASLFGQTEDKTVDDNWVYDDKSDGFQHDLPDGITVDEIINELTTEFESSPDMYGSFDYGVLNLQVSGYYKTQKIRIMFGNQLYAMFLLFLGIKPGEKPYKCPEFRQLAGVTENSKKKEKDIIKKIVGYLQEDYSLITQAIAEHVFTTEDLQLYESKKWVFTMVNELTVGKLNKTLYDIFKDHPKDYKYIRNISMYHMVRNFIYQCNLEKQQSECIAHTVESFPIWDRYLKYVKGIGHTLAGCIIAKIKIEKCPKIGQLWAYCGYDTVENPETGLREGRTNGFRKGKSHHLVPRMKENKTTGEVTEYMSISFSPFMKTTLYKIVGGFIKSKNVFYTDVYRNYKNRIEREDAEKGTKHEPGHLTMMCIRYTAKMFLLDLHTHLCLLNGVIPAIPYPDAYLNHKSHVRTIDLVMSKGLHLKTSAKQQVVMTLVDWDKISDPRYLTGQLIREINEKRK